MALTKNINKDLLETANNPAFSSSALQERVEEHEVQRKVLRNKAIFLCQWIEWPFPLSLFLPCELSCLQCWSHMYHWLCHLKAAFNSSWARRFLWISPHDTNKYVECEQNKCPTYSKVLSKIWVNTAGKKHFCLAAQRLSRQKSVIRNLTISRRSTSVWKQFKTEVFGYQRASTHPGSCSLLYLELIYYCIQSTDYKPGTCGVPQGSDRDPLFFW